MRSVCIYCGSSAGDRPAYAGLAQSVGRALAARGLTLVYGGGRVGLMGLLADAALAAGGEVVGVIPQRLVDAEVAHLGLARLEVVDSMHARKARMAELADAFIALPGGFGTLDELFEILTWAQLGLHGKPCGLLDVDGYYAPLVTWADQAVARGFVRPVHRRLLMVGTELDALLDELAAHRPEPVSKWVDLAREA
ncbi:MAG: TIGR00730 family Rossman fold protein [Xanthomonadales bacterium]|nr:TIGR00730 family Rossman fold protein [Xanthomonadales bacterium]